MSVNTFSGAFSSKEKHRADNFKLVLITIKSDAPASQREAALGRLLTTLLVTTSKTTGHNIKEILNLKWKAQSRKVESDSLVLISAKKTLWNSLFSLTPLEE